MDREIIIPNLHVILIHYPLGLFMAGVVIEVLSVFWKRHSVRNAGHWMVLLGGLSMVPASLTGIYALRDAARIGSQYAGGTWADAVAHSPLGPEEWHVLSRHVWLMSISTAVILAVIVFYLGASDRLRRKLYGLLLIFLLIGTGLMSVGAWYAGEMVYRYGMAVQKRGVASAETDPITAGGVPATAPSTQQTLASDDVAPVVHVSGNPAVIDKLNVWLPPAQPHVSMAGIATAIALASVGVGFRRITRETTDEPERDDAEQLVQSLHPKEPPVQLFPGRFWLVTASCFLLTALGGFYLLASESGTWSPKELWKLVDDQQANPGQRISRRLAHVSAGGALIVLPLAMALLARFAPRRKSLLAVFTLLLVAAIGVQVWFGVLLLFDSTEGPFTQFHAVK